MDAFTKFKLALKKREEENYELLKKEVKKVRETIEKILTAILETTSSNARANYTGLDMY